MSVTNRLASTRLQSGDSTAEVTVTPPGDGLALRLVTTAITERSQASLVVRDSQGRSMGKVICQNGDDKRLRLEAFESGGLVFQVECNLGTVDVQVDELTGHDASFPSSPGGQAGAADIADDSITLAKMADNSVDTPELVNLAVETAKIALLAVDTGQLADGAVEAVKIENLNVTEGKLALGITAQSPAVIADPTGTGTITPVAAFTTVAMADSAGLRVLADPAFDGQQVALTGGGGNNPTVGPATGDYDTTNAVATFSAAADRLVLIGAGVEWRILANVDVALSA